MGGAEEILDVTGFQCPLPVLKARKRLEGLPPGSELTVIASDPAGSARTISTSPGALEPCSPLS